MRKWIPAALILSWIMLMWGGQYAFRGYWEPDEARFVYVAREMADSGNWIVPHRHKVPYPDKPPLMFWLINLGESVLPTPFGSRLPLLIGVILSLFSMYGIGRLWMGPRTGLRAVVVLSSCWQFWDTNGLGQIDGLLLGLQMAALYLLFRAEHEGEAPPLGAFAVMGLAMLAKGPVGLLVPLGAYLAVRLAGGNRPTRAEAGRLVSGLLLAAALPLSWLAACYIYGAPEGYLHNVLFSQNISRAAGALGHRKPFFYYAYHAPLEFMPWTLFLPTAWLGVRRTSPVLLRRLVAWAGFVILFFSIPVSKRNLYIVLALPAMALGVAAAWESIAHSRTCRILSWVVLALGTVGAFGASTLIIFKHDIEFLHLNEYTAYALRSLSGHSFVVMGIVFVLGMLAMWRKREHALAYYALAVSLAFAITGSMFFPELNELKTPDEIEPLAERFVPPAGRLLLYGIFGESLALHADRIGMRCDGAEALKREMREQKRGLFVFLPSEADEIASVVSGALESGEFRMGRKRYGWAAFDLSGEPPGVR